MKAFFYVLITLLAAFGIWFIINIKSELKIYLRNETQKELSVQFKLDGNELYIKSPINDYIIPSFMDTIPLGGIHEIAVLLDGDSVVLKENVVFWTDQHLVVLIGENDDGSVFVDANRSISSPSFQ